jgi:2-oxoglutarate ferredoxin oxidoreductase subunit delta
MKGKIIIHHEKCKGCHLCMTFCPKGAIRISSNLNAKGYPHAEFDPDKQCTGCATCALMCPEAIIEVYRD